MRRKKTYNPKELHDLNDIAPEIRHMFINYVYNHYDKTWQYYGHRCSRCGNKFKSVKAIMIHLDACRYRNGKIDKRTIESQEDYDPYIINIHGEEWTSRVQNVNDFIDIIVDKKDSAE